MIQVLVKRVLKGENMYATIWFYNQHGSLVKRDYEDSESTDNAIIRLREKRFSFRVEYHDWNEGLWTPVSVLSDGGMCHLLFQTHSRNLTMKIARTPKTVQKAQKHATRNERHAFKADLRSLKGNFSDEELKRYDDSFMNQRKIVRVNNVYA